MATAGCRKPSAAPCPQNGSPVTSGFRFLELRFAHGRPALKSDVVRRKKKKKKNRESLRAPAELEKRRSRRARPSARQSELCSWDDVQLVNHGGSSILVLTFREGEFTLYTLLLPTQPAVQLAVGSPEPDRVVGVRPRHGQARSANSCLRTGGGNCDLIFAKPPAPAKVFTAEAAPQMREPSRRKSNMRLF